MTQQPVKPAPNGRAATVLRLMRQFATDRHISGDDLRELLPDYTGDGLAFGDSVDGLHGLFVEARLVAGFGTDAADATIANFVDASFGAGQWRPRKPHLWERGGGDKQLDDAFQDLEGAIAENERAQNAFWATRDDVTATRQQSDTPPALAAELAKKLQAATHAMEAAYQRVSIARAKVTTRQLYLQDRYRFGHAKAK